MRILHVFDHSLPLQSGYVSRSLGIIRAQRTHGWQTVHLTTPRHPATEQSETVDGLKFYRTAPVTTTTPLVRLYREMRATRRRIVLSCQVLRRHRNVRTGSARSIDWYLTLLPWECVH